MEKRRLLPIAIGVGALAVLQAAVVLGYLAVERRRAGSEPAPLLHEDAFGAAPAASVPLERPDGTTVSLADSRGRPVILHFWATWCAPCRAELPALLALADELDGEKGPVLLAVSVDESWPVVGHFFDGEVPPGVVRDTTGLAQREYGVSTLPETYFIKPGGLLSKRFRGARDWSSKEARELLMKELGSSR